MMYRPYSSLPDGSRTRKSRKAKARRRSLPLWLLLPAVAGMLYVFVSARKAGSDAKVEKVLAVDDAPADTNVERGDVAQVFRKRIVREEIPSVNVRQVGYRELFNDSNYVQLTAARANGINPSSLGDPASSSALVPIFSTRHYKVDSMYHSRPYLVPEAALLLDYIAHRFHLIMSDRFPQVGLCNPIVTSALRTEQSEHSLRRVNRNATDTSCHIYGTTFDLSAQRYEHVASGHDTVIDACKEALALALYEIRYEGLCYVKYERGSCFHITLLTTQYEGDKTWELRSYVNPGSPDYLLTKAPPRPKPRVTHRETKPNAVSTKKKTTNRVLEKQNAKKVNKRQSNKKINTKTESNTLNKPTNINHPVTERERLSLDQFERNY